MEKIAAILNIQHGIVTEDTTAIFNSMNTSDKFLAVMGAYRTDEGDVICASCGCPNEVCECGIDPDVDFFEDSFWDAEAEYEEYMAKWEAERKVDDDPSEPYCDGCGRSHDLCDCYDGEIE